MTPETTSTRPHYPVVLLPPRLVDALNARPPLPPFNQPVLKAEDFPPERQLGKTIASTLLRVFGLKKQADEMLKPARLEAEQKYAVALAQYQQAKAAFETAEDAKLTPEEVADYSRRRVNGLLASSAPESIMESSALAGASEAHLYQHLAQHFPNLIQRRRVLKTGVDYHPDYLLFSAAHQLRIDIELDEPYEWRLKKPIHCIKREGAEYISQDAARDEAFLAAGWAVVRFSEMQAIEDPDGCARVVADVLERITGQATPSLAQTKPVQEEPRWTVQDSNLMSGQDIREALLAGLDQVEETLKPQPKLPKKIFVPSENQQRIFDFLTQEDGHGLVVAVAGSGKSTTLLESVNVIRKKNPQAKIVMLAFNKSICQELKEKLQEAGFGDVETYTLNGFGDAVIIAHKGRKEVKLISNKNGLMLEKAHEEFGISMTKKDKEKAQKLYGMFQSYIQLDPRSLSDFQQLGTMHEAKDAEHLQPLVVRALDLSLEAYINEGTYTFDEQNYLPIKLNLPINPYDFVFVDECQDLTQTQLEMVTRAAGEHGRLLFVGDPGQAIMGFRGADNESIQNIRNMPNAPKELPLTVCYRCPKSHITLAQTLMPQIQPAPHAKDGEVYTIAWMEAFDYVQGGDLLFAKTRKLVDLIVLRLFSRGFTLNYLAQTSKKREDNQDDDNQDDDNQNNSARVSIVVQRLRSEASRYKPEKSPPPKPTLSKTDEPLDTVLNWTLAELYKNAKSQYADMEFSDYVKMLTRPDERMGIKVSSAHQSKGLEASRVFVMGYPAFGKSRQDRQPWQNEQEQNLKYVALTRAKDALYLVGKPEYTS